MDGERGTLFRMVEIELAAALAAVELAGERLAQLVESAPDAGASVPGMDWSVGELAAHVALVSEAYARYATGDTEPFVDVSDVAGGSLARTSAARLTAEPERDLGSLAHRLRGGTASLVEATEGRSGGDIVTWNSQRIGLGALLGIGLGEYLVHGLDLAKALKRDWTISPSDARLILASVLPLLPLLIDPATTARVDAAYDLRVRGGPRASLRIHHGSMRFEDPDSPVDCHVSADPVALLLVAYGRRSQWIPALAGKLFAWGRKPWLGLRLTSYLVAP